jgi:Phosphate-selective porin O and P
VITILPRLRRTGATLVGVLALIALHASRVAAQQAEASQDRNRTFEIAPRGYIQLDWRGYPEWDVSPGTGRLTYDTLEVRRARVGVDGRVKQVSFEVTLDPKDDDDGTVLKDAYAQMRFNRAIRLRVGQFKLPGGREYQTSARSIDFMERSALSTSVTPGRDIGAMLTGEIGRTLDYQAGLFAGDGRGRGSRAGRTSAGRVTWNIVRDLEVAGTFSEGRISAVDADPANGLGGRAPSGYRFFDRVYVQGQRIRVGADLEWSPRSWRFTAEAIRAEDERQGQGLDLEDLPSIIASGWSAAVVKEFGRRRGQARSRLREWDLGLRYDEIAFDDAGPATLSDSVRARATDVRPRTAHTLTSSLSWNPVRWSRVMGNAGYERYTETRTAPEPGRHSYWTLGMRLQLEIP